MRVAKFDKIALGEVTINLLGPTLSMVAKAKLVSTKNGASYGSTTIQHWSPTVVEKLKELQALMERDIETAIFVDGDTESYPTTTFVPGQNKGGLSEFLTGEEAPSV